MSISLDFLYYTHLLKANFIQLQKLANRALFLRRNTHQVNTTLDDGQLVYVISSGQFVLFKVAHQCLKGAVGPPLQQLDRLT